MQVGFIHLATNISPLCGYKSCENYFIKIIPGLTRQFGSIVNIFGGL